MNNVRTFSLVAALAGALSTFAGCASSGNESHGQAVDSGMVKAEVLTNKLVDVPEPSVEIDGDTTTVYGKVHRKPGVATPLAGRIDIEFVDTDGEVLEFLPVLLNPTKLPLDPNAPCTYRTEYSWIPPQGSTVRVHFVDSLTAQREDMEGGRLHVSGNAIGGRH